jgi:hypothetical protein
LSEIEEDSSSHSFVSETEDYFLNWEDIALDW